MPNVTLHFMDAADLNGTPLLTVTDEDDYLKAVELRVALNELGGGSVRFARKVGFALFDSGAVQPEVFVRVLVHAYSDTEYFWGFFLDKREQKVIGEEGTEEFIFGGPGPKYYLDRAILTHEQFTGTGWNVDVDNGVFRFRDTATAGRILNRIVQEARTNPIDALPDLTQDFNDTSDSASNAWTNTIVSADDDFELPIGQSILDDLWELEDVADLETRINLGTVADPVFELQAYPAIGTDYSGGAFAVDVLRFAEASSANPNGNIGSPAGGTSLWVKGQSLKRASHVLVRGKDGAYGVAVRSGWDPGEYVKWAYIEYARSSNVTILEAAGTRWMRRQTAAEQELDIPIIPGTDATDGRYFPEPDGLLWVGNTCSLFTGGVTGTPLDFRNDEFRVTGIKLSLLEASDDSDALKRAMSWEVVVQLNTERGGASSPSQGTTGASSGGCSCSNRPSPQLCRHGVEAGTPEILEEHGNAANGDDHLLLASLVPSGAGGLIFVCFFQDDDTLTDVTYEPQGAAFPGVHQTMTLIDSITHPATEPNTPQSAMHVYFLANPTQSNADGRISFSGPGGGFGMGAWITDSTDVPEVTFATGTGTTAAVNAGAYGASDRVMVAASYRIWSLSNLSNTPNGDASLTDDWTIAHNAPTGQADLAWYGGNAIGGATYSVDLIASHNWIIAAIAQAGSDGEEGDCPADVGQTCDVGTSVRAARCDHVHAHGYHSTDGAHAHDADQVQYQPTGDITSTDVKGALDELAISMSSGGLGFHYEVLMTGASPAEPLEDGSGTDWLYVLVPN